MRWVGNAECIWKWKKNAYKILARVHRRKELKRSPRWSEMDCTRWDRFELRRRASIEQPCICSSLNGVWQTWHIRKGGGVNKYFITLGATDNLPLVCLSIWIALSLQSLDCRSSETNQEKYGKKRQRHYLHVLRGYRGTENKCHKASLPHAIINAPPVMRLLGSAEWDRKMPQSKAKWTQKNKYDSSRISTRRHDDKPNHHTRIIETRNTNITLLLGCTINDFPVQKIYVSLYIPANACFPEIKPTDTT